MQKYNSFLKLTSTVLGVLVMTATLVACGEDPAPQQQPLDNEPPPENPFIIPPEDALPPVIELPDPVEEPDPLAPAKILIQPKSIAFPATKAGLQSLRSIKVSNVGGEDLTLNIVRLSPQITEISRRGGSCQDGTVLESGEVCDIPIVFSPAVQTAQSYQVDLTLSHSASNVPEFMTIRGQSQAAVVAPAPAVIPQPSPTQPVAAPPPEYLNALEVARARSQGEAYVRQNPEFFDPQFLQDVNLDYGDLGYEPSRSSLKVDRSLMITSDRYIPAVLENTLSTQIPEGRVVAVVERHVYGADNRYILIPAGSRVTGRYSAGGAAGQDQRIEVQWDRLIRPDGVAIVVDSPSADVMGRLGIVGDLDRRIFERLQFELLVSLIEAAGTFVAAPENQIATRVVGSPDSQTEEVIEQTPESRAVDQIRSDLEESLDEIIQERRGSIRPVLTVPAGTRFLILPQTDLVFSKPTLITAVDFERFLIENSGTSLTGRQVESRFEQLNNNRPIIETDAPERPSSRDSSQNNNSSDDEVDRSSANDQLVVTGQQQPTPQVPLPPRTSN